MKSGENVFLTGAGGCGKSFTIEQFRNWMNENGKVYELTSSTGISALNIGGKTIHSALTMGVCRTIDEWKENCEGWFDNMSEFIGALDILVIDEISMVSDFQLELIDHILKQATGNEDKPFGGIQIIAVGDFFQLPPVEGNYCFESNAWSEGNFITCRLTEQCRQVGEKQSEFVKLLDEIRKNDVSNGSKKLLKQRRLAAESLEDDDFTHLYCTNIAKDKINNERLEKLPGESKKFYMKFDESSERAKKKSETLAKGCLSPQVLELKVGAIVIFTKNNQDKCYMNGSVGRVIRFDDGIPVVKLDNGNIIYANPEKWEEKNRRNKTVAWIEQVPLMLGWAITIHKSQGQTYDGKVLVDIGNTFADGQAYVALSRVTDIDNLFILRWHPDRLKVSQKVIDAIL